jgi:tRNA wybutosine-synthesizing protein 4
MRLSPRPLLIGTSVVSIRNSLLVMGGSAVCFSFGTFWNKGSFTIHLTDGEKLDDSLELGELESTPWRYLGTGTALMTNKPLHSSRSGSPGRLIEVPQAHIHTSEEFDRILKAREPVILKGLSIGTCRGKWTATYLKNRIDRQVIVHQALSEHSMDKFLYLFLSSYFPSHHLCLKSSRRFSFKTWSAFSRKSANHDSGFPVQEFFIHNKTIRGVHRPG